MGEKFNYGHHFLEIWSDLYFLRVEKWVPLYFFLKPVFFLYQPDPKGSLNTPISYFYPMVVTPAIFVSSRFLILRNTLEYPRLPVRYVCTVRALNGVRGATGQNTFLHFDRSKRLTWQT